MFRKRQKKNFPEGTFIPTPARICAIIQLCLAFSLILWYASEPFIGEIFTLKSKQLFYQDIMGIPSKDHLSVESLEHLSRNAERFDSLSVERQDALIKSYQSLQSQLQRSFLQKIISMAGIFFRKIPAFEFAWIVLSIIIPILLLKKIEGATQAVWLLPVLVALYAADVRRFENYGYATTSDAALFPSEQELVDHYLEGVLSDHIMEQHDQLLKTWKKYLIINWAKEKPSEDPIDFQQQAENGNFQFTLARLEASDEEKIILESKYRHPSMLLLILYFFWNVYFAYTAHTFRKVIVPLKPLPRTQNWN